MKFMNKLFFPQVAELNYLFSGIANKKRNGNGASLRDIRVTALLEGSVTVSGANDGSIVIWKEKELSTEEQARLIQKHTRKVSLFDEQ